MPKVNEDTKPVVGKRFLWKFHGDIEKITPGNIKGRGGWVFPDEGGYVFKYFHDYLSEHGLNESLFVVVFVGYSESDKNISEIISLLENKPRRPTFRIGLDLKHLHDKKYIVGPSDYILAKILR